MQWSNRAGSPTLPSEMDYNSSNLGNGKVSDEIEENGDYGTRYSGDSRRNSLAGEQHGEPRDSLKLAPGVAGTDTVKPEQSVRAGVRDRQPVAALDSAIKPVQSQTVNENSQKPVQAQPVQADRLPTENKELTETVRQPVLICIRGDSQAVSRRFRAILRLFRTCGLTTAMLMVA